MCQKSYTLKEAGYSLINHQIQTDPPSSRFLISPDSQRIRIPERPKPEKKKDNHQKTPDSFIQSVAEKNSKYKQQRRCCRGGIAKTKKGLLAKGYWPADPKDSQNYPR